MEHELDILLEQLLSTYPNAHGVAFQSLELPITKANGSNTDVLDHYKDIPAMSVDESFNTDFIFIVTEEGSIIIFFLENLHFISVYTENKESNKELAKRMYDQNANKFLNVINKLNETEAII